MLGIIIVNYKTDDRVIKYVTEELPKIAAPNKVVIVNNACTDQSNQKIASGCGAVWVKDSENIDTAADRFVLGIKENMGYARGNNAGVKFLMRHFELEYLLFSNCDLYYHDDDVIDRLIDKMNQLPDVGMMGPYIESVAGQRQNPCQFESVWKIMIIPHLFYPFIPAAIRRKWMSLTTTDSKEGYCDYLSGSIFLVRTGAFVKAGMFDPQTFLYCEEIIIACRLNQAGFRVYYDDKVKVVHEHSYTAKKLGISWKVLKYFHQSNRYYQKNYRKINVFELWMLDVSCLVFIYIWHPLITAYYSIKSARP